MNDLTISSLIPHIIAKSGIDETKKVNSITREEKERLVKVFKNFEFTFKELENINAGIVTSGGVNVKEKSFEAKKPNRPVALMRCKHCIKYALNMCKSKARLQLRDELGKTYPLIFDCKNCEMSVMSD